MTKKRIFRMIAIVLAVLMPVFTALVAFAGTEEGVITNTASNSKYASPDINTLTGHGEEPEELSVSSGAKYQEKAWYEYVMYSDHAVSSYRLDDDTRILFYDPYTYTNSLVMDVQFDATTTEFDTMSEYSISHTTTKTMTACAESTYTNTSSTQTSGRDETGSNVVSDSTQKTIYNHYVDNETSGTVKESTEYEYSLRSYDTSSTTIGHSFSIGTSIGSEVGFPESKVTGEFIETNTDDSSTTINHNLEWYTTGQTNSTEYSPDYKTTTKYLGYDDVESRVESTTEGWQQLSARVTKSTGSSSSTSTSWSESEGTTVTKKYAATHFASDGVTPLPWAIVHYTVQMPMKCCLQARLSGEWVTVSTIYSLLTTVYGTCRAWMQNGQVYYEDWGNGEPVVAADFWGQFLTKDRLIQMYTDPEEMKLYPVGGDN